MSENVFMDKAIEPTEHELATVLGERYPLWQSIKSYIVDTYPPIHDEWNFPGAKYGWYHRLVHKKRRILYLMAREGYFQIAFIFSDKAIAVQEQSGLPANIIDMFVSAKKYAEGRGARIDVRTNEDAEIIKRLADIKLAN
jgi:hypothetical protein